MGSLDKSPRTNWVQDTGGLPAYIEKIAKSLHEKRGFTISRAIATAVSMCKRWAAGGEDVNADTRAKAAAAIAEWNAKRAAARGRAVDLSHTDALDHVDLSAVDAELETLDLAYGDHKPPYDWKHGYKPISPQAMRVKAKKEKSPNSGKRRRVAGEAPSKGRTPAQAKAADDEQRGRGMVGADTGPAPESLAQIAERRKAEKAAAAAKAKAGAPKRQAARDDADTAANAEAKATPPGDVSSVDPKGLSNAELLTEINRVGAVDRAQATAAQKARLAALSNERHARAEDGRMPKLKGKTRPTAADGSEIGGTTRYGNPPARGATLKPDTTPATRPQRPGPVSSTDLVPNTTGTSPVRRPSGPPERDRSERAQQQRDRQARGPAIDTSPEGLERRRAVAEADSKRTKARAQADYEARYVEARRESRREGATMAERGEAQRKAAAIEKQARQNGIELDEIGLDERARRENGPSAPDAPSGRDPRATGSITPATAGRMSDAQLEQTLDRLAEAGDFSSPAFKAVEAEQRKREDAKAAARSAEGNGRRR